VAADQNTLSVRAKIRDKDGGQQEYNAQVKVKNLGPVPTLAATSATSIPRNGSVSFDGRFTDAGVNDNPWSWTMIWGDGMKTTGTSSAQNSVIPLSHIYAKAGTWSAYLQVKDKEGKAGNSAKITVTVSP
jgi:PKD repeat protein